jgi:hypothetical protein
MTDCGGGICTTVGGMCDACAEEYEDKHDAAIAAWNDTVRFGLVGIINGDRPDDQ